MTRERPLWFGVVLALGMLTREFTLYGLAALLVVEGVSGRLFTARSARAKAISLVACAAVWDVVRLLKPYSSMYGPGTGGHVVQARSNLEQIAWYANPRSGEWWAAFEQLLTHHLPDLFGARPESIAAAVPGVPGTQGMTGLWPVLATVLVFSLAFAAARLAARRDRLREPAVQFPVYLALVGLEAALVYAGARGMHMHIVTMRYVLLALFLPVGAIALLFTVESRRWIRAGVVAGVAAWAVVCVADTGRMVVTLAGNPPVPEQRVLGDYLVAHRIQYGRADYWTAYVASFTTGERVRLASTSVVRVQEYRREYDAHPAERVEIAHGPCEGCLRVAGYRITGPGAGDRPAPATPGSASPLPPGR
jgi:hypothetical protein